jgi:hypothetical protein
MFETLTRVESADVHNEPLLFVLSTDRDDSALLTAQDRAGKRTLIPLPKSNRQIGRK